jgi:multimeric flavodoxin WrbA
VDPIIKKMIWADGIIIGSPVYTWNVSARLKCLMEKCAAFCPAVCTEVSYRFRNKVMGTLVVGGGIFEGQESVALFILRWAVSLGMIVVGSVTTVQDPFPETSMMGGLTSTSQSANPYGAEAVREENTITNPPIMGQQNMRAVRNLGRNVAGVAKLVRAGLERLKEEGIELPEVGLFKTLPIEPAPNSYMAKLVKDGKLQIVK